MIRYAGYAISGYAVKPRTSLRGTKQSHDSVFRICNFRVRNDGATNTIISAMQRGGYVYIMSSPNKGSLYVGMTSDLHRRVFEHRNKRYPKSFTSQYNCVVLVYFRGFDRIEEAISEEKRLKAGSRDQKEQAIDSMNAAWSDLWEDVKNW
jgi:putative endonuclease